MLAVKNSNKLIYIWCCVLHCCCLFSI